MIKAKNLSFYYKKKAPLFDDFSLQTANGSIVGLLGKNGAGKSTLLSLISGLIKPKAGEIKVNGFRPFDRDPDFLADIYMVPEEFSFPHISIGCYIRAFSKLYPAFDRQKMDTLLSEFELQAASNLNKLSHGQRKKFLIAFALATNCRVLILDEPTNGLDIPSKSQFRKILVSSVADDQLVIISTHQVKDIDTIIDKVVVIENGRIVYQNDVEEISRKLHFETVQSLATGDGQIIYHERCPAGYRVIRPVVGAEESSIDLELFFNAIIHQKIEG